MKVFLLTLIFLLAYACTKGQQGSATHGEKEMTLSRAEEIVEEESLYEPKVLKPEEISPPMQSIQDLDKKVEGYHLGRDLSAEQQTENKKLKQEIIRGTFDIKELCRLSLGKHWQEISLKEQQYFVSLMTKLLETKAIFSKEQLRGENKLYSIQYKSQNHDDPEKTKATVVTNMNVPKENLKLEITYKLLLTPYGWKIYDVIVDGASLLDNYMLQFHRIITKDGFKDLINRMEKKLVEISK